jgi:hypothetical protein
LDTSLRTARLLSAAPCNLYSGIEGVYIIFQSLVSHKGLREERRYFDGPVVYGQQSAALFGAPASAFSLVSLRVTTWVFTKNGRSDSR